MITRSIKLLTLPLLVGALSFSACGKKSDDSGASSAASEEVKIPDAPDAAIKFVLAEVAKGNGAVLWQAMPQSYQDDVNSIAQLAGTKIDAEIYDKIFVTVGRVAEVLDKQKEFVFNTSLGSEAPSEEEIAQMRAAWPSAMNLVNALTTSSASTAAGLQSFEGKHSLRTRFLKCFQIWMLWLNYSRRTKVRSCLISKMFRSITWRAPMKWRTSKFQCLAKKRKPRPL